MEKLNFCQLHIIFKESKYELIIQFNSNDKDNLLVKTVVKTNIKRKIHKSYLLSR